MLTFKSSEESTSTCFKFIGANSTPSTTHLISNNTSLISDNTSLISPSVSSDGTDSCSFYSGPSDATIMAFGEGCGSIASASVGESCGSIAYSGGGESCGSVASVSVSTGSSFSGGGCSYSC